MMLVAGFIVKPYVQSNQHIYSKCTFDASSGLI